MWQACLKWQYTEVHRIPKKILQQVYFIIKLLHNVCYVSIKLETKGLHLLVAKAIFNNT